MGECFLYGNGFPGPYNGDVSTSIVNGVLLKGYTDGGAIANLNENNIRDGVNVGGIVGKYGKVYSNSITFTHTGSSLDSYTFSKIGFKPKFIAVQINRQTFFCDGKTTFWAWGGGGYGDSGSTPYNSYQGIFRVTFNNNGFEVTSLYFDFYDGKTYYADIFALS